MRHVDTERDTINVFHVRLRAAVTFTQRPLLNGMRRVFACRLLLAQYVGRCGLGMYCACFSAAPVGGRVHILESQVNDGPSFGRRRIAPSSAVGRLLGLVASLPTRRALGADPMSLFGTNNPEGSGPACFRGQAFSAREGAGVCTPRAGAHDIHLGRADAAAGGGGDLPPPCEHGAVASVPQAGARVAPRRPASARPERH